MFTASANAKGLEIFFDYAPGLPDYIYGDGKRLRQIVLNLVSNAVKFTTRGEVILRVMAASEPGASDRMVLRMEVEDTGPGLNDEQRQQIFEPFYQVGGGYHQQQSGTGLGTTIAANLVRLMDGKIGVNSRVGKGSTFWLEIPCRYEPPKEIDASLLSQTHPLIIYESHNTSAALLAKYCHSLNWSHSIHGQQDAMLAALKQRVEEGDQPVVLLSELTCADNCGHLAIQLRDLYGDRIRLCKLLHLAQLHEISEAEREVYDQFLTLPITAHRLLKMLQVLLSLHHAKEEEAGSLGTSTVSRFLHILVAEDSPINAKVITTFLSQDGHRVDHVENGRLALAALQQNPYDLVFMDMRMPELDGLEATRRWRAEETDGRHVPIVALTANATTEDRNTCLTAGMDEFLSKPVNQEQLRGLIRALG